MGETGEEGTFQRDLSVRAIADVDWNGMYMHPISESRY